MMRLRDWARRLKADVVALWFCARHPRTPWLAKAVAVGGAAYALSPIDLIPDFVPILGYLDDLVLVPAGIWVALRLVPADVLAECRGEAAAWLERNGNRPASRAGAAFVVAVWIGVFILVLWLAWRLRTPAGVQ